MNLRIHLVTPPMTQLNTPYPATAYLKGFLESRGHTQVSQEDYSIGLALKLFSAAGIRGIASAMSPSPGIRGRAFRENLEQYAQTVEAAVRFLQGRDPSLAVRISSRRFLPEGPRFDSIAEFAPPGSSDPQGEALAWAFGALGIQDQAKYLATLFLDDIADVIREEVDPRFLLSRYGDKLAASNPSFDEMQSALEAQPTYVDLQLDALTDAMLERTQPDLLGLTAPFPGNVYGALRVAKRAKQRNPKIRVILGGGYVNTELRELQDPRVFDWIDAIILDDGERPFQCLIEYFEGKRPKAKLLRALMRSESAAGSASVTLYSCNDEHDIPQKDVGVPSYVGLPLESYLSLLELLNPMHRIWSDGRWNKLTLAHGCYWKKCSFCDVTLDYIGRYDASPADLIVDRMVALYEQTGQSGFHFVDEAAPPALLRALSQRLIERGCSFTWWGNIRFDKVFDPKLCDLMARAGCVAVSGGLEVASDRLLKLMNKGVTVEQVARVTRAFSDSGIMVHAYLMYGFPTQTDAETVDALERVRQLFEAGCIQSAFWHRFSVTAHSPVGKDPAAFGIKLVPQAQNGPLFARNDLEFVDPTPADHDRLGVGLRKALYNYMHGAGLDLDVREWFEGRVPAPKVPRRLIANALK